MEQWAGQMRRLWNERFDRLEELLETEMKKTAKKPNRRRVHHAPAKPE
jgi:hypothetical protein